MRDEILSYHEMVGREGRSLQAGMNYHVRPGYSILLMSTRKSAPYKDRWDESTGRLLYEGHDEPRRRGGPDPKSVDQPLQLPSGRPTANGKFYDAAKRAASGDRIPESVRVYEKLQSGIWSDKGMFQLVDAYIVKRGGRKVIDFALVPVEGEAVDFVAQQPSLPHTRLIPTNVKVEVWKRDRGKCVLCGATENLHYDHDVPFARGGSSLTAENVRILCAKHNLQKADRIE